MERFQILCVTMHQKDFSKIKEMNIHSDVVFANQCDETRYDTLEFEGHRAEMISTATRGVGINRNLAQSYSSGDICLIADDDLTYHDDVEQVVLGEFAAHPDALGGLPHCLPPQRHSESKPLVYHPDGRRLPLPQWGGQPVAPRGKAEGADLLRLQGDHRHRIL